MRYTERFYRNVINTDLTCFRLNVEESDLLILSEKDVSAEAENELKKQRQILKQYIKDFPDFYYSFNPVECDESAPEIIRIMCGASFLCNVGPMATVAGAIAEVIGKRLLNISPQIIIENGGDIFLMTAKERTISIFAGTSPFSLKTGIKLKPRDCPFGVATSSATVGHSTSLGNADSVTVVCPSSSLADGLATYFCNLPIDEEFRNIKEKIVEFPFLEGIVVIKNEQMFSWGDLEIVYLE
ncbi:MAG: UPF0280 family protein [Candidatus Omnitrophica bacterium]|nr:UPF0280 family protein [Candidatus Omnitrophota bacterium]MCM8829024.1 UPF0280 family protein [Candidatus Omnitrophota bacterium]